VKVKNKWHYVCIFVNLFNREIIGFITDSNKDVNPVARAFSSIQGDLRDIHMLHTDRGREFKNHLIDETLAAFQIGRSLIMKGCPCDNTVAESYFKIIKTTFVSRMIYF